MNKNQALPTSVENEAAEFFANVRAAIRSEYDTPLKPADFELITKRRGTILDVKDYGGVGKFLKAAAKDGRTVSSRSTIYRHVKLYGEDGDSRALAPKRSIPGLKTNIGYLPAVYIVTRIADSEYTDSVKMHGELKKLASRISFEVPSEHKIRRFRNLFSEKTARMVYVNREEFTRRHNIPIDQPLFDPLDWYHSDTTQLEIKNYDHATNKTVRSKVFVTWVADAASGTVIASVITKSDPTAEDMVRLIAQAIQPRRCAEGDLGGVPKSWRFDNAKIHIAVEEVLTRLGITPDFTAIRCPQENSRVEMTFRHLKAKVLNAMPDWRRIKPSKRDTLRYDEVEALVDKHIAFYNFEQRSKGHLSRYHRWVHLNGPAISKARRLPAGELELQVGITVTATVKKAHIQVDNHHLSGKCLAGWDNQEVTVRYLPGETVSIASVFRKTDGKLLGYVENPFDRPEFAQEMAENRLDFRKEHLAAQAASKDLSQTLFELVDGPRTAPAKVVSKPKPKSASRPAKEPSLPVNRNCAVSICEE